MRALSQCASLAGRDRNDVAPLAQRPESSGACQRSACARDVLNALFTHEWHCAGAGVYLPQCSDVCYKMKNVCKKRVELGFMVKATAGKK